MQPRRNYRELDLNNSKKVSKFNFSATEVYDYSNSYFDWQIKGHFNALAKFQKINHKSSSVFTSAAAASCSSSSVHLALPSCPIHRNLREFDSSSSTDNISLQESQQSTFEFPFTPKVEVISEISPHPLKNEDETLNHEVSSIILLSNKSMEEEVEENHIYHQGLSVPEPTLAVVVEKKTAKVRPSLRIESVFPDEDMDAPIISAPKTFAPATSRSNPNRLSLIALVRNSNRAPKTFEPTTSTSSSRRLALTPIANSRRPSLLARVRSVFK